MLIEDYAFNRLWARFEPDMVKFWRTADGNEVDFVIMQTPESGMALIKIKKPCNCHKAFSSIHPEKPGIGS
ncbi:DUF4143 domain-containing protein [Lentimicrobium sp.]|jgi:hypothetical protein|uniref:DUF4143 domain-containing protein n=1 Tax=Lentimicrobium sp. TaxID=2034841 RepID=UPI00345BACC9